MLTPYVQYRSFYNGAAEENFVPVVSAEDGAKLVLEPTNTCYTHIIRDKSQEWELVVLATCNQASMTGWSVLLVQVDGGKPAHRSGYSRTDVVHDDINAAIYDITQKAGWIVPFNRSEEG